MVNPEVGKSYVTRGGSIVKILDKTDMWLAGHDMHCPYLGDNGKRYSNRGKINWCVGSDIDDLRAEHVVPTIDPNDIGSLVGALVSAVVRRFVLKAR